MPARYRVNKSSSSKKFRKQAAKTNARNIAPPPKRGGYRM